MSDDDKRRPAILPPSALAQAAHALGDFSCWVDNDTRVEDVLKPMFWQNHVPMLRSRIGSRITVLRRDLTLDVVLRVIGIRDDLVSVRMLTQFVDDSNLPKMAAAREAAVADGDIEPPAGYKVGHTPNGAEPGWWVQLKNAAEQGPPKFVKKGLSSKGAAVGFAREHKARAEAVPAQAT